MMKKYPELYSKYITQTGFFIPKIKLKKKNQRNPFLRSKKWKEYKIKKTVLLIGCYLISFGMISILFFVILEDIIVQLRFPPPSLIGSIIPLGNNLSFIQFIPIIVLIFLIGFSIIKDKRFGYLDKILKNQEKS